jgi:hypothetical protein
VVATFPQSEEEAISKAQQFELIYSQLGYLYTVLPDAPRPVPFGQDKPGMSHSADGLIGTTTHHNPYPPQPTIYGTHPYPLAYGGNPYYPPPLYQQLYPVVPPQSLGAPPPVPMSYLVSQSSTVPPPTHGYNLRISGRTSTSYTPYGSYPQNNPYFPFPSPTQPANSPPGQPHASVNFVHPFPIQQVHTFE